MLIRILIEKTQPLAGTAATKGREPLHFDGWLELLRVISELVAAAGPPDGGEGDPDRPTNANRTAGSEPQ